MGQQQLLLLVLAAVIVGIAIVGGVNMFDKGAAQANVDAVTQDLTTIASLAQSYYRKPTEMGGGERTFTGFTLDKINWPASNENGGYALGTVAAGSVTVVATLHDTRTMTLTVTGTGTTTTMAIADPVAP